MNASYLISYYWSEGGEAYAAPELSGTEPVKEREKVIAEVGLPTAATGPLAAARNSDPRDGCPEPGQAGGRILRENAEFYIL